MASAQAITEPLEGIDPIKAPDDIPHVIPATAEALHEAVADATTNPDVQVALAAPRIDGDFVNGAGVDEPPDLATHLPSTLREKLGLEPSQDDAPASETNAAPAADNEPDDDPSPGQEPQPDPAAAGSSDDPAAAGSPVAAGDAPPVETEGATGADQSPDAVVADAGTSASDADACSGRATATRQRPPRPAPQRRRGIERSSRR